MRFLQASTPDFDEEFDSYKLFGSQPIQLYAKTADDVKTALNSIPVLSDMTIVPVGIQVLVPGSYKFTAHQLSSFTLGSGVFLEDLKKNIIHNLMDDSVYSFTADTLDNPDRFVLLFSDVYTGTQKLPVKGSLRVYSCGQSVFIRSDPSLGNILYKSL